MLEKYQKVVQYKVRPLALLAIEIPKIRLPVFYTNLRLGELVKTDSKWFAWPCGPTLAISPSIDRIYKY
jgi:hypothetical protein